MAFTHSHSISLVGRRAISVGVFNTAQDRNNSLTLSSGRDSFGSTTPLLDSGDAEEEKNIPSIDIIGRSDTLPSPRVSPVPWLQEGIPSLVVTSAKSPHEHRGKRHTLFCQILCLKKYNHCSSLINSPSQDTIRNQHRQRRSLSTGSIQMGE